MAMKVRYQTIDGVILSEIRGGVRKQYVPDSLGSTIAMTDSTRAITDTFEYWPYGEVRTRTGTTPTPFQYCGTLGYSTDSNGIIYVRARYMSTTTTRWLTEDPIRFDGGLNLFAYALNRPTVFIDSTGLIPCWVCEMLGMTNPIGYCWSHCDGGKNRVKPAPNPPANNPSIGVVGGCFPFGDILSPKGDCMAACLAAGAAKCLDPGGFVQRTCKTLCYEISMSGCDGLLEFCGRYEKEYIRKTLCTAFWNRECSGV